MNLRFGLDCYNFAGTISAPSHPSEKSYYHTYWRADLAAFGTRQEYMLKSFFATQHLPTSHLTLWSNGDLSSNHILQKYLSKFPESFSLRIVDTAALARGTPLEGSTYANGGLVDKKAWVDGDLLRLLLLWNFGGVWVDMDTLITRDMNPLTQDGQEWVTQWDCYDKPYSPLNGALMHFTQHSPYLCEAFDIMATSPSPRPGSTDWGSLLYLKLYRRLVKGGVQPFKILPWCFSDARSCRLDNRLPDPFVADDRNREGRWGIQGRGMEEGAELDKVLGNVFSVHLHNQWEKEFPKGGWVERLLLRRFEGRLEQL
ncbi:hypothetical protein VNI00_009053 [Paramarasmius palmivorus]|uniref:Glycosyltransferase family 32 protein n=1 Tax=Paramarasmius palmivorus TaxID=297713 RepID=A0AAW0CRF1_9AGAR